jgi:hypothetical protein
VRSAGNAVMQVDDLELAAEFCKLVGAPNLLAYLALDESATPDEARARLKARRKFMQGMQGNPKYKREALFLIRHFSNLNDVLGDLTAYAADARRRAESVHLPVIEMTVRGVIGAGVVPTEEQIAYLRRNALELGVSETSFREIVARVAGEVGVVLPTILVTGEPTPVPAPARTPVPVDDGRDLYTILGLSPDAEDDDVRVAYFRKMEELEDSNDRAGREALRQKYEHARKALANETARKGYDPRVPRGPQQLRQDQIATAPPVRERTAAPGARPPRLEILGDPVRTIYLGAGPSIRQIEIRNGGDGQMAGSVVPEVRWLSVDPVRLDPKRQKQTITVWLDRKNVPEGATSAGVVITTERGEKARVVFELRKGPPAWVVAALAVVVLLGAALVAGLFVMAL